MDICNARAAEKIFRNAAMGITGFIPGLKRIKTMEKYRRSKRKYFSIGSNKQIEAKKP
jgi:hypothetical protein